MQIIEGRVERRFEGTAEIAHQLLGPAEAIVRRRMGGGLGSLSVAVTSGRAMENMLAEAHRGLFGVGRPPKTRSWWGGHSAGHTTVAPYGTLVVINAQGLRGNRTEIAKTVLHELAHAAQFARPGRRDEIVDGERHNYRLIDLDEADVRRLNRQVGEDEREARRMERYHRDLLRAA